MPECAGAVELVGLPIHAIERDLDDVRRAVGAPPLATTEIEAGDGFLATSGLPLRAGRDFVTDDLRTDRVVTPAIVPAWVAQELWPDRDPLGARFVSRAHGPAVVVGVVDDTRNYLFGVGRPSVIYARGSSRSPHTLFLVRSTPGNADALRAALRERLAGVPGQAAVITPALAHARSTTGSVMAVLGVLGTIVGTIVLVIFIGSMGLTYFLVAERTREIGLRRAMGATRRDVVRTFVVENLLLTAAGAVIGIAIALIVLPTMFYEQPDFVVSWRLVALSMAAVVVLNLVATMIPARKAATIPPVVASRSA